MLPEGEGLREVECGLVILADLSFGVVGLCTATGEFTM